MNDGESAAGGRDADKAARVAIEHHAYLAGHIQMLVFAQKLQGLFRQLCGNAIELRQGGASNPR